MRIRISGTTKCAGNNQALIYKEQHYDVLFIQVIYLLINLHSLSVNYFWHEHYLLVKI